jgi:hypothetical protein
MPSSPSFRKRLKHFSAIIFWRSNRQARRTVDQRAMSFISRWLVLAGFPSRKFLTCCLLSRQLRSSVYVCEKVCDFTQPMRSSAGKFDQFLVSSSRVRCSLARQLFTLSLGVWLNPAEPAARQLAVRSQFGTPSATGAARVRRAEASVGQNEMPSAEAAARASRISRRNMTTDILQLVRNSNTPNRTRPC